MHPPESPEWEPGQTKDTQITLKGCVCTEIQFGQQIKIYNTQTCLTLYHELVSHLYTLILGVQFIESMLSAAAAAQSRVLLEIGLDGIH